MTTVSKEHITKTPGICGGKACIAGHRIRVMDIVGWHDHGGWSPARIVEEFPGITLADVYAALAYYHDHPAEIEAEFEKARAAYEAGRAGPSKVRDALARNPGLLDELRERFGA